MAKEELKAGIFTLTAIGILSLFLIVISGYWPWKETVSYRTRFPMIAGVTTGTPVSLNGVKVGQVTEVRLIKEGAEVEVEFTLDEGRLLREGVLAEMATVGLIGDTYILLTQTRATGKYIPPGEVIPSVSKLGMAETMNAVGRLAAKAEIKLDKLADRVEEILVDLQLVINKDKMKSLSGQVDQWRTLITTLLKDATRLSTKLEKVTDSAGGLIDEARAALEVDQDKFYEILNEIDEKIKVLGPQAQSMMATIEAAVADTKVKLASMMDKGEKMMGKGESMMARGESILTHGDKIMAKTSLAADLTLEEVVTMANNLAQASRNLISLTERLKDDPSLLIRGTD